MLLIHFFRMYLIFPSRKGTWLTAVTGSSFLSAVLAFLLTSCTPTVKIKTNTVALTKQSIHSAGLLLNVGGAASTVAAAFGNASTVSLKSAQNLERKGRHIDAAGHYLKVAADAHVLLTSGSEKPGSESEKALLNVHNTALARFTELWVHDPRRLEPGPYHLSSEGVEFEIDLSKTSYYQKDYFDRYIPARAIEEVGMVRNVRNGFGAPAVGIRDQLPGRAEEMSNYAKRGLHTSVTVTMDSVVKPSIPGGATQVTFSLRNPMLEDTVSLAGRDLPLAADYTAPIAVVMKGRNQEAFGLEGFFKAEERLKLSGIFMMEPYDSKRIPVLFIHGLISSPYIWCDIIAEMMADPELSKRYQFMVFGYPSSLPLPESAALLRQNLAALRAKYDPSGNDPLSQNMIVAGHSMGGMLTHCLVADFGDNIWKQFSDTPLDELPVEEAEKANLRRLVTFEPDPAVKRVVYFSAPHRGAEMAEKDIAGLLSKMAKLPSSVTADTAQLFDPRIEEHLKIPIKKVYTSRESLTPGAPMVAAMDISPYKPGVVYHSVIGDQGKGDTPNSSDGVVDYWSSHQAGAASELIVPTGHDSFVHPHSIEELRRILYLHVAEG